MHDHNLDDLIIENIEPKHSKTKSLLTIIALLIVVLIVAIIFTKTLLKTPDNSDLVFEQDVSEMIAPELKLKEPAKVPEPEKASSLSTVVESEIKAPAEKTKRSEVISQKEKTASELKLPNAPKMVESKKAPAISKKDAADIAYWESVQAKRKAEKEQQIVKEQKAKEAAKKSVEIAKRPQSKKVPVLTHKKPVTAKPVSKTVSTKRYYIQVGAFKTQPSKHFLSVIKNNGLTYHITKPNAYNMKQLLIGPYKNQASAKRALAQVRDRIMKRAFIVVKR